MYFQLLDDNRELYIPETQETVKAHPKFMLFATQNPPGHYGGRKVFDWQCEKKICVPVKIQIFLGTLWKHTDVQADLSFCLAIMPEGTFAHVVACLVYNL